MTMTYSELVKNLSLRLGRSQAETKDMLNGSTEIIKQLLDEDKGITIPGLGTFNIHIRQKRKSYNPQRRKLVIIPPKRTVTFHPCSTIKDELKEMRIKK
jgi:nucleoid DNA-binding protein